MNPVPVIVTGVPPALGPVATSKLVMVGTGAYENWSAGTAELAANVLSTTTSTGPEPDGEVAVHVADVVEGEQETLVAELVPNFTVESVVKPVPVMVTTVPPPSGPASGVTWVTVGAP